MTTPIPDIDTTQWTFFHLPLEIRLLIYHACLTKPSSILIPMSPSSEPNKSLIPALLLTSHRLHAEAHPILYSNNTFVLDTRWPSLRFLQDIKPRNVCLIQKLHMVVSMDYDGGRIVNRIHYTGPLWCEVLKLVGEEASGLREMRVEIEAAVTGRGKILGAGRDEGFFRCLAGVRFGGNEGRLVLESGWPVGERCRGILEDGVGRERVVDRSANV